MSLLHNEIDYLQTVLRETFRLCIYSQSLSESQRRSLDESYNILLDAHFGHFRERILTQTYSRNAPSVPDVAPSSFPQVVVTKSEQQHQPPTLVVGETLFEPAPVKIKQESTDVKNCTVNMPDVVEAIVLDDEQRQGNEETVEEVVEEIEEEEEVAEVEVEEEEIVVEEEEEEEVVEEEEEVVEEEEEVVEEEEEVVEEEEEETVEEEEEESEIVKIGKKKYFVGVKTRTVNIYIDDETMGETLGQLKDGKIIPLA
jgi:type IV secretory pathway VirB10-like protein